MSEINTRTIANANEIYLNNRLDRKILYADGCTKLVAIGVAKTLTNTYTERGRQKGAGVRTRKKGSFIKGFIIRDAATVCGNYANSAQGTATGN